MANYHSNPPPARVDETELYFLIAHALSGGPFAHLGEELAREAAARNAFPSRVDFAGTRHPLTYEQARNRYPHLHPGSLRHALQQLLVFRRGEARGVATQGLSSVLDPLVLPGAGGLPLLPGFSRRLPLWTLQPASNKRGGLGLPPPHLLTLRETGQAQTADGIAIPPAAMSRHWQHHVTVRGHSYAAYCVAFDNAGCHIITGSDDRLVKIWSATTALLQCTCRGHQQEIADLSVSCDDALFASASVDGIIRVWALHGDEQLGLPIAVLRGHTALVTSVDFSPTQPRVLLSSSFDGTCRVWDARDASVPPVVVQWGASPGDNFFSNGLILDGVRATRHSERRGGVGDAPGGSRGAAATATGSQQPQNAARGGAAATGAGAGPSREGGRVRRTIIDLSQDPPAASNARNAPRAEEHDGSEGEEEENEDLEGGAAEDDGALKFVTASFSRDGEYIFAGGKDCCTYVWHWPGAAVEKAAASVLQPSSAAGVHAGGGGSPVVVVAAPRVALPTCAREVARLEGHRNEVYLLQHSHRGDMFATGSKDGTVRIWRRPRRARRRAAPAWECEATLSCPVDEEAVQLARQRRRQLPPPRVDQIAWNADDTLLIASMEDLRVHVFSVPSGRLLHSLPPHSEPVHVLMCHPRDPALAVSASYAGEAVVWDIASGKAVKSFDSKATRPDGRTWPDGLPFTDGFMAPNGEGFVLVDAAGQAHMFGIGPRCPFTARAPYDQFLSTDYAALIQDVAGNVASAETQLPAHVLTGRELLCDATGAAYPAPFQEAFRAKRLLSVSASDAEYRQSGQQPGYLLAAPILTAAVWRVSVVEGRSGETSAQNAIARASQRLEDHERAQDAAQRLGHRQPAAAAAVAGRTRGAAAGAGAGGSRAAAAAPVAANDEVDSEDWDNPFSSSEEELSDQGGARRHARQSSRLAGRRQAVIPASRRVRAANREQLRVTQRQQREERAHRRQIAHMRALEQQRRRLDRLERTRNGGRLGPDEADDFEAATSSEELVGVEEDNEEEDSEEEVSLEDEFGEDYEGDDAAGPSRRGAAGRRRPRQAERRADRTDHRAKRARTSTRPPSSQAVAAERRPRPSSATTARPMESYAWLSMSQYTAGFYVPQMADEVVYVREGHAAVLEATSDARPPPWKQVPRGRTMRAAEPCVVSGLQYVIQEDAVAATVARVTLELSDPASPLKGSTFVVDIPSPASGQAEFVVLRSRFDVAVVYEWNVGDEVSSYWQTGAADDDGVAGEWWRGSIIEDRRGTSAGVAADPFTCGGLWERYLVQWEGPLPVGDAPPRETEDHERSLTAHSPWELHPLAARHVDPLPPNTPLLAGDIAGRAAAGIAAAAGQDRWAIFQAAPEWDEAYRSLSGRAEFYNRRVALPLGLMDVSARLEGGFYRHAAALEHDVRIMADNAAIFNGPRSDLATDARCMSRYLLAVIHGEEGADPGVYAAMADEEQAAAEEDEGEEEEEEEEEEQRGGGGVRGYNQNDDDARERERQALVSRRAALYEDASYMNEQEEPLRGSRRPARRAAAATAGGGSGNEHQGVRSGRYSLRDAARPANYADFMQDDELEEAIEEGAGRRARREPTPPQHAYGTRRAAPHAPAPAAVEGEGAVEAAHDQTGGTQQRRMRIRLTMR